MWKRFRADLAVPQFYDQLRRWTHALGEKGQRQFRWVLKDINLTLEPGSTTALIGINGSGKTTLLKVISQVTYQTAGRCDVKGRIGALLNVQSGLHPDLTGRENIYLYGAVLGMGRQRVRQRFDEIVEFAGLEDSINRQSKFYSAGMTIRLGFTIAAFLEPDILLVDEVLAVGDANFQRKCLKRITEVVKQGTTLLYVSHDLATVEATCDRSIWLANAVVQADGPTKDVLEMYRGSVAQNAAFTTSDEGDIRILKADIKAVGGGQLQSECDAEVTLTVNAEEAQDANFWIGISQGTAFPMFVVREARSYPAGDFEVKCRLDHLPLPKGRYSVWAAMTGHNKGNGRPLIPWKPVLSFDMFGPSAFYAPEGVVILTPIYVNAEWQVN
jgi:ABC-type polysaccharide/polyol phosphate transport system ATPase subunit